jgi:endonuclease G, mitochondrial
MHNGPPCERSAPTLPQRLSAGCFMVVMVAAAVILSVVFIHDLEQRLEGSSAPRPRPELTFGTPSDDFIARHGYIIGRSTHYTPWVIEHLTSASFANRALRTDFDFYSDDDQPAECRWTNRDYLASGFDRGHLAAADNQTHSAMAMRDSFCLTNTMPQTPELNRGAWRMLEEHVGRLAAESGVEVWVATGPAWLPDEEGRVKFQTVGSHAIWAPTHCWKAAFVKRPVARGHGQGPSEKFELSAWLLPNTNVPPAFDKCRVSVDEIERVTGLDLWAGLPDELERELEASEK